MQEILKLGGEKALEHQKACTPSLLLQLLQLEPLVSLTNSVPVHHRNTNCQMKLFVQLML